GATRSSSGTRATASRAKPTSPRRPAAETSTCPARAWPDPFIHHRPPMDKNTAAVIPVREGSTRLKNKNIAPFAGTNLLLFKIEQLKCVPEISQIVVTSDSDHMLAMAAQAGVKTHKRAPEYCDEK